MLVQTDIITAKKVIHVVGPIVQFSLTHELEQDLANCYINTLNMCMENSLKDSSVFAVYRQGYSIFLMSALQKLQLVL